MPTQSLESIQVMADHLHNWYDGAAIRQGSKDSSDNIDMQKLKENIHAIQDSWRKPSKNTMKIQLRSKPRLINRTKNLEVKVEKLTKEVLTNEGNMVERIKENIEKVREVKKEPVP
nr:hypothetical protein [Tanacetum cinerariifolium]